MSNLDVLLMAAQAERADREAADAAHRVERQRVAWDAMQTHMMQQAAEVFSGEVVTLLQMRPVLMRVSYPRTDEPDEPRIEAALQATDGDGWLCIHIDDTRWDARWGTWHDMPERCVFVQDHAATRTTALRHPATGRADLLICLADRRAERAAQAAQAAATARVTAERAEQAAVERAARAEEAAIADRAYAREEATRLAAAQQAREEQERAAQWIADAVQAARHQAWQWPAGVSLTLGYWTWCTGSMVDADGETPRFAFESGWSAQTTLNADGTLTLLPAITAARWFADRIERTESTEPALVYPLRTGQLRLLPSIHRPIVTLVTVAATQALPAALIEATTVCVPGVRGDGVRSDGDDDELVYVFDSASAGVSVRTGVQPIAAIRRALAVLAEGAS